MTIEDLANHDSKIRVALESGACWVAPTKPIAVRQIGSPETFHLTSLGLTGQLKDYGSIEEFGGYRHIEDYEIATP